MKEKKVIEERTSSAEHLDNGNGLFYGYCIIMSSDYRGLGITSKFRVDPWYVTKRNARALSQKKGEK